MNKPENAERDTQSDRETKKQSSDKSTIPTRPEDTDASGDALNGTGEDNHHKQ